MQAPTFVLQVRHLEAIMRIAESFCKMRLSEYCSAQDIDRAIAVTVDSFIDSQKVSAKRALARTFAKYISPLLNHIQILTSFLLGTLSPDPSRNPSAAQALRLQGRRGITAKCGINFVAFCFVSNTILSACSLLRRLSRVSGHWVPRFMNMTMKISFLSSASWRP